jgi:hypothetical protein
VDKEELETTGLLMLKILAAKNEKRLDSILLGGSQVAVQASKKSSRETAARRRCHRFLSVKRKVALRSSLPLSCLLWPLLRFPWLETQEASFAVRSSLVPTSLHARERLQAQGGLATLPLA